MIVGECVLLGAVLTIFSVNIYTLSFLSYYNSNNFYR